MHLTFKRPLLSDNNNAFKVKMNTAFHVSKL